MAKKDFFFIVKIALILCFGVLLCVFNWRMIKVPSIAWTRINSAAEFDDAITKDVGDIAVSGIVDTDDPITIDGIEGEYVSVKRVKEELTTHTKTTYTYLFYTWAPSTKVYESWDESETKIYNADTIRFCGKDFQNSKFAEFADDDYMELQTVQESAKVRYKYYGIRKGGDGVLLTSTENGSISEKSQLHLNQSVDDIIGMHVSFPIYFLCFMGIYIGASYLFFYERTRESKQLG